MSVCKDCIHFEACVEFLYSDYDCCDNIETSKQKHANDDTCVHFKATADVVEVVRCRDCKHFTKEFIGGDLEWLCKSTSGMINPVPDFYCGYGERREE